MVYWKRIHEVTGWIYCWSILGHLLKSFMIGKINDEAKWAGNIVHIFIGSHDLLGRKVIKILELSFDHSTEAEDGSQ